MIFNFSRSISQPKSLYKKIACNPFKVRKYRFNFFELVYIFTNKLLFSCAPFYWVLYISSLFAYITKNYYILRDFALCS